MPSFGIRGLLGHVQTRYGLPHGRSNTCSNSRLSKHFLFKEPLRCSSVPARNIVCIDGSRWFREPVENAQVPLLCWGTWELEVTEQSQERCLLPFPLMGGQAWPVMPPPAQESGPRSGRGWARSPTKHFSKPHCAFCPRYRS